MADRGCGEHTAVAASAGDDHLRAPLQQVDEGMDAGHRHDPRRRIEFGLGERHVTLEARDDFTGTHAAPQVFLIHFGVEIAETEWFQPMPGGELLDDSDVQIDAAVRAGVSRGTDDHRHAEPT